MKADECLDNSPDIQPKNFVITMHVPSEFLLVLKNHPPFSVMKTKKEDFQDQMQLFILPSNKKKRNLQIVKFSCSVVSDSLRPPGLQHTRIPCPSPTPGACSNSCPSSRWCHPTISSSVDPFSSCLQSFPASGSFLTSQFFASGGQSIEVSASASVLSMDILGNDLPKVIQLKARV